MFLSPDLGDVPQCSIVAAYVEQLRDLDGSCWIGRGNVTHGVRCRELPAPAQRKGDKCSVLASAHFRSLARRMAAAALPLQVVDRRTVRAH